MEGNGRHRLLSWSNYSRKSRVFQGFRRLLSFEMRARYTPFVTTIEQHVYSVSELNRTAKSLLEGQLGEIWVRGEISELTRAASGHVYFTLKDETCEVSGVRFRSRTAVLPMHDIQEGTTVLAFGRLTVYEPRGRYQLVASLVQPLGAGALQLAFEKLKKQLDQEGLFAPEHKKPIPRFPNTIGVITSSSGAAIRDIVSVLQRRWPQAAVFLFPSAVQGEAALQELPAAIERAIRFSESSTPLDLLILGRGGGSAEDLAAFNAEVLARTVYACPIPIVSAVGHEIDFSISDFVADTRAATPTAAAELVTPSAEDIGAGLLSILDRLRRAIELRRSRLVDRLDSNLRIVLTRDPARRLETLEQRLDQQTAHLPRSMSRRWSDRLTDAVHLEEILRLSDPRLPLRRGYSLTFSAGSKSPLREAASMAPGEQIETHLAAGRLLSRVEEVTPE